MKKDETGLFKTFRDRKRQKKTKRDRKRHFETLEKQESNTEHKKEKEKQKIFEAPKKNQSEESSKTYQHPIHKDYGFYFGAGAGFQQEFTSKFFGIVSCNQLIYSSGRN